MNVEVSCLLYRKVFILFLFTVAFLISPQLVDAQNSGGDPPSQTCESSGGQWGMDTGCNSAGCWTIRGCIYGGPPLPLQGVAFIDKNHDHIYNPPDVDPETGLPFFTETTDTLIGNVGNVAIWNPANGPIQSSTPQFPIDSTGYFETKNSTTTYVPSQALPLTYIPNSTTTPPFVGWSLSYEVSECYNFSCQGGGNMFIPGYTANPSGFGAQGNKLLTAYIIFDGPYEVSGAMWYDKNGDGVKNGYWFYIDQNGNNAKDTSEPSRNCTSTSDPACSSWRLWYIDSENIQPGTGGSFSTSPYTISYSAAGTYQINASIPPGYTLRNVPGNTNPRSVTVNANLTNVNFELASVSTPQCAGSGAGLSVNPTGVYARNGSYATFTVGPCTPLTPTPQYRWPTPTAGVFPTPTCGVNCVYQPPPSVCSVQTITQSVEVSNGGGASTYSASLAILPYNQATGVVYTDTGNNNCSSGETVKPNTQVLLVDGGSGVTSDSTNTNSSGVYTLTDTVACSNKHIIIPGQTIKRVRPDGGAWSSTGFTGSDYGPFTFTTPVKTVDFCLGGFDPWYQTDKGDVRFVNLFNALPTSSSYASTETLYPSVFFSSASTPDFNGGNASTLNWQIGREYTYNKVSAGTLGGMSYTFYDSQTKKKNVSVLALPGCPANPDGTPASGNCTLNFSSIAASPKLPSGVYKVLGNLTIQNTYAITQSDQHVVILVQGETFIGDTTTPASITTAPALGNLFILASKGTMHISPLVGTSNYVQNGASSVTQLDGYYTSEGSIGIESNADCSASTPVLDLRLNMGGMVTANSLHPLQTGQSGRVVNYRTLCNTNATSPSFFVKYRADFLTQMTDFYKTTLKTFKEVAP